MRSPPPSGPSRPDRPYRRSAIVTAGTALLALITSACMAANAEEIGDVSTVFKFIVYR